MRAPFPRPSAGSVCQPFTGGDLAHGCAGAACSLCAASIAVLVASSSPATAFALAAVVKCT